MSLFVQCKCGWVGPVPDTLAGSQVQGPNCSTMVDVPSRRVEMPRPKDTSEKLWKVALFQRHLIYAILLKFIAAVAGLGGLLRYPHVFISIAIASDIYALVAVLLLAYARFGVGGAVVWGMFMVIPVALQVLGTLSDPTFIGLGFCMGFISLAMLLILNGLATSYLRKHGVHVGLLGARWKDLTRNSTSESGEKGP